MNGMSFPKDQTIKESEQESLWQIYGLLVTMWRTNPNPICWAGIFSTHNPIGLIFHPRKSNLLSESEAFIGYDNDKPANSIVINRS